MVLENRGPIGKIDIQGIKPVAAADQDIVIGNIDVGETVGPRCPEVQGDRIITITAQHGHLVEGNRPLIR